VTIRVVLFDWGGTLVRDDAMRLGAPAAVVADYVANRMATALSAAEFERAFQAVLPAYEPGRTETAPRIDRLIGAAFTWLGIAAGGNDVDACSRLFFQESSAFEMYDDARALVASLKYRGYRLGVVTNSLFPSHLFARRVKELGLAGYLDAFVASADVGLAKPNPGPFLEALRQVGAEPHETLFVGDTVATDIAGAKAAGMRAVLVERKRRAHEAGGYVVIERLGALNDFLGEGTVA
jgi:putative hydrolase of the HAD superfamily